MEFAAPATSHARSTVWRSCACDATITHRPTTKIIMASTRSRAHRRQMAGAATEPSNIPSPHEPMIRPSASGPSESVPRMNSDSSGALLAAAISTTPITMSRPRTSGVVRE